MADRRAPGLITGAIAGTRRSLPTRVTLVFMPNPRGSTGYGQQFVAEISGDWGGKVFIDIKNGVAQTAALPYVDKNRIGGAGASYGGYMIDWIEGHNNDPRFQFKVLVSHDGVYNLTLDVWRYRRALVYRLGIQGNAMDQ